MTDAGMAAQMTRVCVADFCNNHSASIVQGITNQPMTDREDNYLPVVGEDGEIVDDSDRIHLSQLAFQRMIDFAIFRYE